MNCSNWRNRGKRHEDHQRDSARDGTPRRNLTFVKIETDEGLVGVAEARVVNRTEMALGFLSEAVLEMQAADVLHPTSPILAGCSP